MSHLTPRRTVRITPGGGAVPPPAPGVPTVHDPSWGGLIADLARALDLDGDVAGTFAQRVDETVEAFAHHAQVEVEVARTRVRSALLGNTAMLDDLVDVDLSDARVVDLLGTWDQAPGTDGDRVLARLSLLHTDLVGPGEPAGEGAGGSARPLPAPGPAPDVHVGQVAYTLDAVPTTAKDVVLWIGEADTADDRRARAQAARDVEQERGGTPRTSVAKAIDAVLGG